MCLWAEGGGGKLDGWVGWWLLEVLTAAAPTTTKLRSWLLRVLRAPQIKFCLAGGRDRGGRGRDTEHLVVLVVVWEGRGAHFGVKFMDGVRLRE